MIFLFHFVKIYLYLEIVLGAGVVKGMMLTAAPPPGARSSVSTVC